jgi:hypothetical protein
MAITPLRIPRRYFGQPIPVAPDMNQAVDKVDELVAAVNEGLATSNAIVGGPKFVRYTDSRYFGVGAADLTLDRLDPATVLPGNLATVINSSATPTTASAASVGYVAAIVPAGTAGAFAVPAYSGAPAGDTVLVAWQEVVDASSFTALLASELGAGKADYAGLALRPLLIKIIGALGTGTTVITTQPPVTQPATGPTVTGFLPSSAAVGASVTLTGTGFTKATAVLFSGTPASFQPLNATTLLAEVPVGATTGPVSVTNSAGTGTSVASFTVGATPITTPPTTTPALTAALAISVASIVAGSPLTFTVTAGGGTAPYSYAVVATNNSTGATTVLGSSTSGSFTPQTAGSYNIDATVTDSAGKVAQAVTRTVQVTAAQAVNQIPVANAGQQLTIQLPTSSAALMGSGSDPDPGDSIAGWAWRQVTGPKLVTGMPSAAPNLVVSDATAVGTYQFGLVTTDTRGAQSNESFVVLTVIAAATAPATSLTSTPADYHYSGNILRQNGAGQNLHAGLSVLKVGFTGNAMTIRPFASGGSGNVYVKDSGSFAQSFSPSSAGQSYALANLTPPVYLTTGGQQRSYERGDVQGADYLDLSFPNGATGNFLPFQQAKRAIAVFNDSIGQGATLPLCQTQAWTMLLRNAGNSVTTLGYGSGTGSVMLGAANRAALKAQLHIIWDGASEQVGVFSLFTNDYGGAGGGSAADGGGSPSSVRALLVDFLQDMKAEFPNAKFLVLTPFYRGDENNGNSYGAVLEDYRTSITSAASGFANVTVRSGKGILVPGSDYTPGDVIHPNPPGHIKIFNFVAPAIDSLYNTASSTDLVTMPGLADATWAQLTNTGQTGTTLSKTSGGLNWDAGAVANRVLGTTAGAGVKGQLHIPGNLISRGGQAYSSTVIGLSDSPPDYARTSTIVAGTPVAYITIRTAFYFDVGGYGLIEAGQEQPFVYVPWTVGVYPDFDIQYTDKAVKFYVAGKLFYTSAFDPTPYPYLYVAACLLNQGVSTVKGITLDGVNLLPTPALATATSTEDDASTRRYSSGWVNQSDPLYSAGAGKYNAGPNDGSSWFEESFTGTSVIYFAVTNAGSGPFDILIDGQPAVSGTSYSSSTQASHEVARVTGLAPGNHVIRVVKTGGGSLYADKLVYPDGYAIP